MYVGRPSVPWQAWLGGLGFIPALTWTSRLDDLRWERRSGETTGTTCRPPPSPSAPESLSETRSWRPWEAEQTGSWCPASTPRCGSGRWPVSATRSEVLPSDPDQQAPQGRADGDASARDIKCCAWLKNEGRISTPHPGACGTATSPPTTRSRV